MQFHFNPVQSVKVMCVDTIELDNDGAAQQMNQTRI